MFGKNKEKESKKKESKKNDEKKEPSKKEIREHPELYIKVKIIKDITGMIESHYIYASERKFKLGNTTYKLKPYGLILEPMHDNFLPMYIFKEGKEYPIDFTNKNKRIPARVLTLLYNLDTYRILIQMERKNLNLILVIIGIVTIGILAVYGWLNYGHGQIPKLW
jgi:hypothetical protein